LRLNLFDATLISCDKASAASEFLILVFGASTPLALNASHRLCVLEESQFGKLEGWPGRLWVGF